MKRTFRAAAILSLLGVLFRGLLYRLVVHYDIVDSREINIQTNVRLQAISDSLYKASDDMDDFILGTQRYVASHLTFRTNNSGPTAAKILAGGEANCVGYARLTADLLNRNMDMNRTGYYAEHTVAKMTVFGVDVHQLTHSPFFRDHDVVTVVKGGKLRIWTIDPSLYDYTRIRSVRSGNLRNTVKTAEEAGKRILK